MKNITDFIAESADGFPTMKQINELNRNLKQSTTLGEFFAKTIAKNINEIPNIDSISKRGEEQETLLAVYDPTVWGYEWLDYSKSDSQIEKQFIKWILDNKDKQITKVKAKYSKYEQGTWASFILDGKEYEFYFK